MESIKHGKVNKWSSDERQQAFAQLLQTPRGRRFPTTIAIRNNDMLVVPPNNFVNYIRIVVFICLLYHASKVGIISMKTLLRIVIIYLAL